MSDAALLMDRMYAWQMDIYDATRRFYLLGRDELIASLAPPAGGRVLEIGCGTGRNIIRAAQSWPKASYFGLDISEVMLTKARAEIGKAQLGERVQLGQADATGFDAALCTGHDQFDRVYFSYTLSMIPDWEMALAHALTLLAPGGALMIVDFGDQRDLPQGFRKLLRRWLTLFSVEPRDDLEAVLRRHSAEKGFGCDFVRLFRGYAFIAALRRPR